MARRDDSFDLKNLLLKNKWFQDFINRVEHLVDDVFETQQGMTKAEARTNLGVGESDQDLNTTDSPEFVDVVFNSEHATDSGTDTYDSASTTTQPSAGKTIARDFQSANTTTTPTLDGVTIKTRGGFALWREAIDGPHKLQYDGTVYLLLDPATDIRAALQIGLIVAAAATSDVKILDPRDFSDAGAAIQDANNFCRDNGSGGTIWLPLADPDGNNLVVSSTVTIGSSAQRTTISMRQPGYGLTSNHIHSTINDGTATFVMQGDTTNNLSMTHPQYEFMVDCGDNDTNAIVFKDVNSFRADVVVNNLHGDAIQVDGACSGFWIRARIQCGDDQATPTANMITFLNTTGNGPPANFHIDLIGDGNCLRGIHDTVGGVLGMEIFAHIERTQNNAVLINEGSGCVIRSGSRIGNLSSGSGGTGEAIRFNGNGGRLQICDGVEISSAAVHGIRVWNNTDIGEEVHISPNVIYRNIGNDDLHIQDGPAGTRAVVPYEETFAGTVTYPAASNWGNITYTDGWQFEESGTKALNAGSTTVFGSGVAVGRKVRIDWGLNADPGGADTEVSVALYWDDSAGSQKFRATESVGSLGPTLTYKIYSKA